MTAAKIIRDIALAGNEVNDPLARAQQQVGALEQALRNAYAEFKGEGMKPQPGSTFHKSHFGDAEVLVEYDYEPEEAPVYNLDSPMCGPGCAAQAIIICVLINGVWVDGAEFPEPVRDRWEQEIIDGEIEASWQDRMDRAAEEAA